MQSILQSRKEIESSIVDVVEMIGRVSWSEGGSGDFSKNKGWRPRVEAGA